MLTLSQLNTLMRDKAVYYHHGVGHSGYCVMQDTGWWYINRRKMKKHGAIIKASSEPFTPSGEITQGWSA